MDWEIWIQRAPSKIFTLTLSVIAVLFIGFIDWITGSEISLSIFYLLPLAFAVWYGDRRIGVGVAFLATVVWLASDLLSRIVYSQAWIAYWNACVRLGFFLITGLLLDRVRLLTIKLSRGVRESTEALQTEVYRRTQLEHEAVEISRREQERVAHELHDQLGACLGGIAFRIKAIAESLERRGAPEAADACEILRAVNNTLEQVRGFARLLAPVHSGTGDLWTALSQLTSETQRTFGVVCTLSASASHPALSDGQAGHLFRIAQEAVRNAIQHARAARIDISLAFENGNLKLSVRNDGRRWECPDRSTHGLGLRIMHYRTRALGGTLSIKPDESGQTLLTCEVPLGTL